MAAPAAVSAEKLQEALDDNLARLRSAQAHAQRIRERDDADDIEAAAELTDASERIDRLLDERNALRGRL